nr:hypothetical protein [uncultured Desulfuromonas sp.]
MIDKKTSSNQDATPKRSGRPRKHDSDKARVQAWRAEKKHSGRRIDCHVGMEASSRIVLLAKVWECSIAAAVERCIIETAAQHHEELFPSDE